MGYTFSIAGAGYHEEPMVLDGEPVLEDDGSSVMETVCDEPEMSLSYVNASALFSALGITEPEDKCGSFELEFLPELRRRIICAKNGELPSRDVVREGILVVCGLSRAQLEFRLEILERMAVRAQELGQPICFA